MEYQNILNLLNEANNSKFVTKKQNMINDQSKANYDVGNEIIYQVECLKSQFCDYNGTNISVRGHITIIGHQVTRVAFKSCASFIKYIRKTDGTTIDDAKIYFLVMPMYNLLEYSSNYSETIEILWFYSKLKQLILMQMLLMVIILNF